MEVLESNQTIIVGKVSLPPSVRCDLNLTSVSCSFRCSMCEDRLLLQNQEREAMPVMSMPKTNTEEAEMHQRFLQWQANPCNCFPWDALIIGNSVGLGVGVPLGVLLIKHKGHNFTHVDKRLEKKAPVKDTQNPNDPSGTIKVPVFLSANPLLTVISNEEDLKVNKVIKEEKMIDQKEELQCTESMDNRDSFCLIFSNKKTNVYYTTSNQIRSTSSERPLEIEKGEYPKGEEAFSTISQDDDNKHFEGETKTEQKPSLQSLSHQESRDLDESMEKEKTLSILTYFNSAMAIGGDNEILISKVDENGDIVSSLGDYDILVPRREES